MGKYIRQTTQFSLIKTRGKKEVGSRHCYAQVAKSPNDHQGANIRCKSKRVFTTKFLLELGLPPIPTQVSYSSLPVLPPRQGGDEPGVDLMGSLTDVQLFTIKTLLASDATWGAIE